MLIKTFAAVAAATVLATSTFAHSTIRGDSYRLRENAIKRTTQGGDDVEASSAPYKNRVGHISVRHMCDDGVLSRPRPSFGCLKLRPMMSTKSSRSTLASGSNE